MGRAEGPRGDVAAVRPPRRVRFDLPPQADAPAAAVAGAGALPVNGQELAAGAGGGPLPLGGPRRTAGRPGAQLPSAAAASPYPEEPVFGVTTPSLHDTARYCHGTLTTSTTAPSTISSTLSPTSARTSGALALVTAAREGDDDVLGEILRRAAITGLPPSVANYRDSGGRVSSTL